ncbi:hypothetical protein LTS08_008393 [Lithohypha guttulata]|nr:hypothetical protein LTS08_008393 [Lithohypha guttulata]
MAPSSAIVAAGTTDNNHPELIRGSVTSRSQYWNYVSHPSNFALQRGTWKHSTYGHQKVDRFVLKIKHLDRDEIVEVPRWQVSSIRLAFEQHQDIASTCGNSYLEWFAQLIHYGVRVPKVLKPESLELVTELCKHNLARRLRRDTLRVPDQLLRLEKSLRDAVLLKELGEPGLPPGQGRTIGRCENSTDDDGNTQLSITQSIFAPTNDVAQMLLQQMKRLDVKFDGLVEDVRKTDSSKPSRVNSTPAAATLSENQRRFQRLINDEPSAPSPLPLICQRALDLPPWRRPTTLAHSIHEEEENDQRTMDVTPKSSRQQDIFSLRATASLEPEALPLRTRIKPRTKLRKFNTTAVTQSTQSLLPTQATSTASHQMSSAPRNSGTNMGDDCSPNTAA